MIDALAAIVTYLLEMANLAGDALSAKRDAFIAVANGGIARNAAIGVAVLAGMSELLGQSFILAANRTPVYRILLALTLTAVIYPVMALAWTCGALFFIWLFGDGADIAGRVLSTFAVVSLAFAPRLLGVLTIAPYFGVGIGRLLDLWAMALVMFGLHEAINVPAFGAAAAGLLGWVAQYLMRRTFGRLFAVPIRRLRAAVIGSPFEMSPQAIVDAAFRQMQRRSRP